MSTNAKRLADAVLARRTELDATQLEIWQAGGPSNTTLTDIENGRVERLTRTTARRLDAGLRWEPGSARRVWDGGSATPLGAQDEVEKLRQRVLESSLSDERKAALLATLDEFAAESEGRRGA